jgi:2-dehydro-3-deoxyphosphogluconate aldolase/(4S)-4-hydroxy-2-oxoglutarate aldolase
MDAVARLEQQGDVRYGERVRFQSPFFTMPVPFHDEVARRIQATGVIAVMTLNRVEDAVPLGRALLEGGIDAIELTLRTPAALPAIARLRQEVPELMVGAGTVLTPSDLEAVQKAGAAFGVSPGVSRNVLEAASRADFSFAPGVMTPSDIETAVELGCRMLKFFPVEPCGGLRYFQAVTAPYEHLGLRYIPLGALTEELMVPYLQRKSVVAIGGSWIASGELIAAGNWAKITALSRQAVEIARRERSAAS